MTRPKPIELPTPFNCEVCNLPIPALLKGRALCFKHYDSTFRAEAVARADAKRPPDWWVGQRGTRYADKPIN